LKVRKGKVCGDLERVNWAELDVI